MRKRFASVTAAVAAAAVLSLSAYATNGGVVGNVVDAGENIVNDVVDAGENVVDSVTDAVTGNDGADGNTSGNTSGSVGGTTSGNTGGTNSGAGGAGDTTSGTTDGTTGGTTNGTTGGSTSAPADTDDMENDLAGGSGSTGNNGAMTNPDTGISFPFAALSVLALGGAGVAFTLRKNDE
ncbi:MAG: hypothetical protein J6A37_14455 [Oscillospiraceae bacterium]|nr:hypothetical protein [Oscillospiraceae bacterium]